MDLPGLVALLALAAGALGVAALGALGALWWLRRSTGLRPSFGEAPVVVASDTGAAPGVMLRDPALGLRGRPDYLMEERTADGTVLVPIEVKPTRRSTRLYESDAVQLGAYLLALRATHGERAARYGEVHYSGRSFRVELTAGLAGRVRATVAAVRAGRSAAVVHRSHDVPARCARCPMREACDERLA